MAPYAFHRLRNVASKSLLLSRIEQAEQVPCLAGSCLKWKYFDPTRRITPASIVTAHH